MRARALPPLALVGLLAACGTFPQPFRGNPGQTAQRLASEPPIVPRLVVPAPSTALLPDSGGKALAALLARDLQLREVPAYAEPGHRGDWVLAISATDTGQSVVPVYTVRTPQGRDAATLKGTPVPVAAWAAGAPSTLERTADDAARQLSALLAGINTDVQRANPNSLLNRKPRIAVLAVRGAPGDGDAALARLMRANLAMRGEAVQDTPAGADFLVRGEVRVVPIAGGQERVEIQWIVTQPSRAGTPGGAERGRVVQLNNVPAGSLHGVWGDVAQAVAEEASGGVRDVVQRQTGRATAR
ncbi:MAG TPA: hypothetical protein VJ779_07770 [Acetobacteraceae bacterium]|nr:hypothetical protein [Acetobacteraceae bacterium]